MGGGMPPYPGMIIGGLMYHHPPQQALVGKAAGDAVGPYGAIPKRIAVEYVDRGRLAKRGTTFRPYYVRDVKVAVFGRDEGTGLQVWSASHGYPGDYLYREFHRKDDRSGLQYWRITGAQAADIVVLKPSAVGGIVVAAELPPSHAMQASGSSSPRSWTAPCVSASPC